MIERRHVDHYAAAGGVDRSVAERDVVLTYVLKMMTEDGIIDNLAFKGGTCIRKIYLGGIGRFSEDLDFTLIGYDFRGFRYDVLRFIQEAKGYGFTLKARDPRGGWGRSFACDIEYSHEWSEGSFKFEVSLREDPVVEPVELVIKDEIYFRYTEFQPFSIPCMSLEEVISEKIRAAYQRGSARDFYDLYQFAERPYNRSTVNKLAVIKFWNNRSEYDPVSFFEKIKEKNIDFSEIQYLLKNQKHPREEEIKDKILCNYRYLTELDDKLRRIIMDVLKHREKHLVKKITEKLRSNK